MPHHLHLSDTIHNPDVAAVFASYPPAICTKLLELRRLIFETAALLDDVGELEEALKWGEPSYLTPTTKSGSTVRIAWKASQPDQYAIYFKCTADLVEAFKTRYPTVFTFGGSRSLQFTLDEAVPMHELQHCIALALTYHRNKKLPPVARWEMVENLLQHGASRNAP
ncbi:MAG: DUF1801 domain-containing protein [bacterium]|nr:DUF1801 domain-containing protein [bacterium]